MIHDRSPLRTSRFVANACAPARLVALTVLLVLASGCEKEEAARQRLTGVEDRDGRSLLAFAYEDCQVTTIDYLGALPVNPAPADYPDPLVDGSVRRERITCTYAGDELTELRIDDILLGGTLRTRLYAASYSGGVLSKLTLTDEHPQPGGTPLNRDLSFHYDAQQRVDSIAYGPTFTAAFTYDARDNITVAQYRNPRLGKATKEFYGYADGQGANPLLATPLRFVQPYAGYWSASPLLQATAGLRKYEHLTQGARVIQSAELTLNDTLAVQLYTYEATTCRE